MSSNHLQIVLTRYNNWDSEAEKEEYIDMLEGLIATFNISASEGIEAVPDSTYDVCIDYLRALKPDSPLLHQLWTKDDETVPFEEELDKFLVVYPMLSIQTVKHSQDKIVKDFQSNLPIGEIEVCSTIKLNGHAVRVVWKDGKLVKANSRGRSTNGRDLTNQMQILLGEYCESFKELGLVEMRGEVVLPFNRLEKARGFNPNIKSAFSGVASMIRASATPEETKLLDVVFYDILTEEQIFDTLTSKLDFIEDCGFLIPEYLIHTISRRSLDIKLDEIVTQMDIQTTDYQYYSDGVVVSINDLNLFSDFGAEDSYRLGNMALKMGRWKQDTYSGVIDRIEWMEGKSKKTPVAILEEGVLTATGNTVTNIPLYAPLYILTLEAYPGNVIHFRYGGEAGVIPVTPDGRLVTDRL